jgi:hypothetical protein
VRPVALNETSGIKKSINRWRFMLSKNYDCADRWRYAQS